MIEYILRIGEKPSGVTVRPDGKYPQLWHIHRDERVSDMVNLSRAKDAAIAWARPRGLGGDEKVYWDPREIEGRGGSEAVQVIVATPPLAPSP